MHYPRLAKEVLFMLLLGLFVTALPATGKAQFRNNGMYLPQLGYLSLELMNGKEKFGSGDAGYFGVGGLHSLGYNFWVTYRLWVGFSEALLNHEGSDVLVTVNTIGPGIRYNFLDESIRPYTELALHLLWFPYTEGSKVPVNKVLGQALFGGPRLCGGLEWYFQEEMSLTAEIGGHLYLTIDSFFAVGVSGMAGYTVYY